MATTLTDNSCRTCSDEAIDLTAHTAAADPHPQYLTQAEGDAAYAALGDGAAAVVTHEGEADPHPNYLLETDAASTYRTAAQVTTAADLAITNHEGVADPHPLYADATDVATAQSEIDDLEVSVSDRESGYAVYVDATNTGGTEITLVASTDTDVPNDASTSLETELPTGVTEFWDGTDIVGVIEGDLLYVSVAMTLKPSFAGNTYVDFELYDTVTSLGQQYIYLPKGDLVDHPITFVGTYRVTSDWVTNGARPVVNANQEVKMDDISFTIARIHSAA